MLTCNNITIIICYLSFLSKSDLPDCFSTLHKNLGFISLEFVKPFSQHSFYLFLSKILELVSKELNHLAAILHFMKLKNQVLLFKKKRKILFTLLIIFIVKSKHARILLYWQYKSILACLVKSLQKEGPKKILAALFFESFFSTASCKKGFKKRSSQKIFRPF